MSWVSDRLTWLAMPWDICSDMQRDMAVLLLEARTIPRLFTRLEKLIMATADALAARIDAATNEVASDLKAVRDRLAAVAAAADTDKQAAVDAALAQLDGPIARLEALGADPADPVPDQPAGPVPAPEVPADDTGGDFA